MKLESGFRHTLGSSAGIQSKKIKLTDIANFYVERTKKFHKTLNSHLFFDEKMVFEQVEVLEKRAANSEHLPLLGTTILVKDNICTKNIPTTCASKILENYRPPYNASVVEFLKNAGALILGKTNCDEFAMGSSNENSAYGAVKNPWNLEYVPGGSSGGSAAAVAADLAMVALGSDTGGSIRQPASFCGIVGFKPSYGSVSRFGLIAFGSSLDQIGPMTRSVADAANIFDILAVKDPKDSTNVPFPNKLDRATFLQQLQNKKDLKGLKFGVVKEFFQDGLSADVMLTVLSAIEEIKKLGGEVVEVSLPMISYSIATYYVIATAEASSNLARFDGIRYGKRVQTPESSLRDVYLQTRSLGFGKEVKQRIMLGTFVLSSGYYDAYFAKASNVRKAMALEFDQVFKQVDFLVSPTSPTTAFKLNEKSKDPISMYLSDICTIAANLVGVPAISMPCGFDQNKMPIGLQMMGRKFEDQLLLTSAHALELSLKSKLTDKPKGFDDL